MMAAARLLRLPNVNQAVAYVVIALAWGVALSLSLTQADQRHHHALPSGHAWPALGTVLVFLVAWQVMTAAMMLPSSLPLIQLFVRASGDQQHAPLVRVAFFAGYFAVWTWFALMALAGDAALRWLAGQSGWLRERPWLIGALVLLLAGAFQFSPLKERCLRECRLPLRFLQRHYRRGIAAAWDLGLRHGIFCLGCCWALMLTMFAVGVGSLVWMAALTGVMVIEKTLPWGRRLSPAVGAFLVAWAVLILAQPAWLPPPLALTK